MTTGAPAVVPPDHLPSRLDRRFEGVVLWSSRPSLADRTARLLRDLAGAGMAVAWIAPLPVTSLAERLGPPPDASLPILVADSRGSGRAEVGPDGPDLLAPVVDHTDLATLAVVADGLVRRLAAYGLSAQVVDADGSATSLSVEFATEGRVVSRAELKRLLHDHALGGIADLADLATEEAHRSGVTDVRVAVDRGRVVLAAADSGDVALDGGRRPVASRRRHPVAARPARRHGGAATAGRSGGRTRRPGGHLRAGRWSRRPRASGHPDPRGRGGAAAPGAGPPAPPATAPRPARPRCTAGWSVETCDDDGRPAAARDALVRAGRRSGRDRRASPGRPTGRTRSGRWPTPSTTGSGPATHLLAGPVPFALGTAEPDRPVVRLLDLRTGVLYERSGSDGSAVESVRFLALDRPTTAVIRASVPGGHRTGPPVRAPGKGDRRRVGSAVGDPLAAGHGNARWDRRSRRPVPEGGRRIRSTGPPDAERWSTGSWPSASGSDRPPEVADVVDAATDGGRRRVRPPAGVPPPGLGPPVGGRRRRRRRGRRAAAGDPVLPLPPDGLGGRHRGGGGRAPAA